MAFFIDDIKKDPVRTRILSVSGLNVSFVDKNGPLHVVRDMEFEIFSHSRTAILGETGCGKSVLAMAIFGLLPENSLISGHIRFNNDTDLLTLKKRDLNKLRGKSMVLAPQNPMGYLNPVLTVGFHLTETILQTGAISSRKDRQAKALSLLSRVGFKHPDHVIGLYPHQLSGGMAQRVLLAMGLAGSPGLVVADEPTKGLDIPARDLYLSLTRRVYKNAAFLMITHDIDAAATCDRIMVMYCGRVVEDGPARNVLSSPVHPYTQGLIAAHPDNGMTPIPGTPPQLTDNIEGCGFHPRCSVKKSSCCTDLPHERQIGGQKVRCCHA